MLFRSGTGNGKFAPEDGMSRAMLITVLGRMYEASYGDIESAGKRIFEDSDYESWYGRYLEWASENGIIDGYDDGTFRPDVLLTREQIAAILQRFANHLGKLPENMDEILSYGDAEEIAEWAKEGARYCQATGIVQGTPSGDFDPKGTASRGQVATMIQRLVEVWFK